MPIDIRCTGPAGLDTTITILNNSATQTYSFEFQSAVDSVQLDPNGWIFKEAIGYTSSPLPAGVVLHQNYPNPFRNATVIRYDLPHKSRVHLTVCNILGQIVDLIADNDQVAGPHIFVWNAKNYPTGVYFLHLSIPENEYIRPMMITR